MRRDRPSRVRPRRAYGVVIRGGFGCAAVVLGLLAAPFSAALAQDFAGFRHDASQPIAIEAETLEVDRESQTAAFRGAVDVMQGGLALRAGEITVHYEPRQDADTGDRRGNDAIPNTITRIEASENVVITSADDTARGDWSVYDVTHGLITVGGSVVLTSAGNVLKGERLVIDLKAGRMRIEGAAAAGDQTREPGGRVRGLFAPPDQTDGNE